jgi:putative transposase
VKTLRLKVKQEAWPWLRAAAKEVNFVWNWANETSEKAIRRFAGPAKFLTPYDLHALTTGATNCFDRIGANVINAVCTHFARKRRQAKAVRLSWRKSGGSRRSLGWIPFKNVDLRRKGNAFRFCGKTIRVFESVLAASIKLREGCFAEDSLGQWWLCLPVEVEATDVPAPREIVGIDLGLKTTATTSDGDTLEAGTFYRGIEEKIGQAQRRGHKRQAKRLHLKAKNRRADALHKFTRKIVNTYQNIRIGNVSSSQLAKTKMAKSVLDAGWYMVKTQLLYKGENANRSVEVVDEAYTTRACSSCGALTGPAGLAMLVVRDWRCSECGTEHKRDVNAARNIAATAPRYRRPSAGTSKSKTHECRPAARPDSPRARRLNDGAQQGDGNG